MKNEYKELKPQNKKSMNNKIKEKVITWKKKKLSKYHLQWWKESLFINATRPPIMLEKEILRWSHPDTKTILEPKSKHQLKARYLIKEKEFNDIHPLLSQTWGVKYPRLYLERSTL